MWTLFAGTCALGLLSSLAPALADDYLKITDVTFTSVVVQYRVSGNDTVLDSTPGETKTLNKGETWKIPTSGERIFWRREQTPGSNDGQWTDWTLVHTVNPPPEQKI